MHPSTFSAFQDELTKIAYTHEQLYNMARGDLQMSEAQAQNYVKAHQHYITGKPQAGPGISIEQPAAAEPSAMKSTAGARGKPGPPVPDGTGVVPAPKHVPDAPPHSASGLTNTHVRPATGVAHAPAAPHPAVVPGGGAGLLRRGAGLARAHAAPLAIGAGVATLGAVALNKMRQKNAPPR